MGVVYPRCMVSSAIGAHPQPERQQRATSIIYIVLEVTCTTLAIIQKNLSGAQF